MNWEIQIPHQDDRSQTISEAISAHVERELVGEERDVAFQLLFDPPSGVETVGDLIDHVESLDSEGRRRLLDKARGAAGLETTGAVDAHREFERANASAGGGGSNPGAPRLVLCAEPNCAAMPQDETGAPVPTRARRWLCPVHEHLAEPGDDQPPEPEYVLDPSTMTVRAVFSEAERLRAQEAERQKAAAEREQLRREEAGRLSKLEREWQARNPPNLYGLGGR